VLAVLVFTALLVLIVGFMVYDRVSSDPKVDRKAMNAGFVPGESSAWVALAALSGTMIALGFGELLVYSEGPRGTGRYQQLVANLEAIFGEGFFGYSCLALGVLLAVLAFREWRKLKRSS
jgi:hypothetical protein